MATYVKYETFVEKLADKLIDYFGTTDTWRAIIHTDAPTVATDAALSDFTEIGNSNGYTTGGENITFNSTRGGGTVTSTAVDVVWTASGGSPLGNSTTGRYFTIYDDTSTGNWASHYYDYTATFTVASGETMTLDFGASLGTLA